MDFGRPSPPAVSGPEEHQFSAFSAEGGTEGNHAMRPSFTGKLIDKGRLARGPRLDH